jgi:hypothetical protein
MATRGCVRPVSARLRVELLLLSCKIISVAAWSPCPRACPEAAYAHCSRGRRSFATFGLQLRWCKMRCAWRCSTEQRSKMSGTSLPRPLASLCGTGIWRLRPCALRAENARYAHRESEFVVSIERGCDIATARGLFAVLDAKTFPLVHFSVYASGCCLMCHCGSEPLLALSPVPVSISRNGKVSTACTR